MSVTGKHTLTYTDNAAHIRASLAPPSMTFVDQHPQVTIAKDSLFIMTYTDDNTVTIEAPLQRNISSEIEISGSIQRIVQSDTPFPVDIRGDLRRCISNFVELNARLERTVVSYNMSLRYGLRRIISNTVTIEGNLSRNIISQIQIDGDLRREILNDGLEVTVPSKKYESFINIDKLFRVQHDVLDEDISDNPYFAKQISNLQNAALLTNNQTIIKAINELYINQRTIFQTAYNSFKKINDRIGDVVDDPNLKEEYLSLEVNNVIEGLLKLSTEIEELATFVGSNEAHAKDSMEILGYSSLLDGLIKIRDYIYKSLYDYEDWTVAEVEWIFASEGYNIAKEPFMELLNAVYDEVHLFEQKVGQKYLEYRREIEDVLTQYMNLLDDYDDISDEEVKNIFLDSYIYSESEEGQIQLAEDTLILLINNIDLRLRSYQQSNDARVLALEDQFNTYKDDNDSKLFQINKDLLNTSVIATQALTNIDSIDSKYQNAIVSVDSSIVGLNNRLNAMETRTQADIDSLKESVTNILNQISTMNEKISNLQTRISNLELSVTSITTTSYQNIVTQVNTVQEELDANKTACEDLDTRIKSIEENFTESSEDDINNMFG